MTEITKVYDNDEPREANLFIFCDILPRFSQRLKGCIPVTRFHAFIRAYTHVKVEFALHPTLYEITKFI
jgi:hypothetical protein